MAMFNFLQPDDDLLQRLKRRADENSRSPESEVRRILHGAVEDDMAAKRASFRATAAKLRRRTEGCAHTPSEDLIREDRERGHRVG